MKNVPYPKRISMGKTDIRKLVLATSTSLNRVKFEDGDAMRCVFEASDFTRSMESMNPRIQSFPAANNSLDKTYNIIEKENLTKSHVPPPMWETDRKGTPLLIKHFHKVESLEADWQKVVSVPLKGFNIAFLKYKMKYSERCEEYSFKNRTYYTGETDEDYFDDRLVTCLGDIDKQFQSLSHQHYIGDIQHWNTDISPLTRPDFPCSGRDDTINPIVPPAEMNYFVASNSNGDIGHDPGFKLTKTAEGAKKCPVRPAARFQSVLSNHSQEQGLINFNSVEKAIQVMKAPLYDNQNIKLPYTKDGRQMCHDLTAICNVPQPAWKYLVDAIDQQRQTKSECNKGVELAKMFNIINFRYYNGVLFLPAYLYQTWGNNDVMAFDNGKGGKEYYTLKYNSNADIDPDPEKADVALRSVVTTRDNPTDMPIKLPNDRRIYRLTFIAAESMMLGFLRVPRVNIPEIFSQSLNQSQSIEKVSRSINESFFVPLNIDIETDALDISSNYTLNTYMGMKMVQYHAYNDERKLIRTFDRGRATLDLLI